MTSSVETFWTCCYDCIVKELFSHHNSDASLVIAGDDGTTGEIMIKIIKLARYRWK